MARNDISQAELEDLELICRSLEEEWVLDGLIQGVDWVRREAFSRIVLTLSKSQESNPRVRENFPFLLYRLWDALWAVHFILSEIETYWIRDVPRIVDTFKLAVEWYEQLKWVEASESELVTERDNAQLRELALGLSRILSFLPHDLPDSLRLRSLYASKIEKNEKSASNIYEEFFRTNEQKLVEDYIESAKLLELQWRLEEAFNRLRDGCYVSKDYSLFEQYVRMAAILLPEEVARGIFDFARPSKYPYPFSFHRGWITSFAELGELRSVVWYFGKHLTDNPWYVMYFETSNAFCNHLIEGASQYALRMDFSWEMKLDDDLKKYFRVLLEALETQLFYLRDFTHLKHYFAIIDTLKDTPEGQTFLFEYFTDAPLSFSPKEQAELTKDKIERCGTQLSSFDEDVGWLYTPINGSTALENGFMSELSYRYVLLAKYIYGTNGIKEGNSWRNEALSSLSKESDTLEVMRDSLDGMSRSLVKYGSEIEDFRLRQWAREQFLSRTWIEVTTEFQEFREALILKYGITLIHVLKTEAMDEDYTWSSAPHLCLVHPELSLYFFAERILAGYEENFSESIAEIHGDHKWMYLPHRHILFFAEMLLANSRPSEAILILSRYPDSAVNLDALNCIIRSIARIRASKNNELLDTTLAELDNFASKMSGHETFESLLLSLFQSYREDLDDVERNQECAEDEKEQIKTDLALSSYLLGATLRYSTPSEAVHYLEVAKWYGSIEALVEIAEIDLEKGTGDPENIIDWFEGQIDTITWETYLRVLRVIICAGAKIIKSDEDYLVKEKAKNAIHHAIQAARNESDPNFLKSAVEAFLGNSVTRSYFYSYFASVSDDDILALDQKELESIRDACQEDLSAQNLPIALKMAIIYTKVRLSTISESSFTLSTWWEFLRVVEDGLPELNTPKWQISVTAFAEIIYQNISMESVSENAILSLHAFASDIHRDAVVTIKDECIADKKIKNKERYKELLGIHAWLLECILRIFSSFKEAKDLMIEATSSDDEHAMSHRSIFEYWQRRYYDVVTTKAYYETHDSLKDSAPIRTLGSESVLIH